MVTQRVRVPCPNCSHRLHIRVEDLGRKGQCKRCGYLFRPRVKTLSAPLPHRTAESGQTTDTAGGAGSKKTGAA